MARLWIFLWIYCKAHKQLYLISIFSISFTRGSSIVIDPVAAWPLKLVPISVIRRLNHSVRRTIILSIRSINLSYELTFRLFEVSASEPSDFSLCWPSNHSTYQLSKSSSFIGQSHHLLPTYPSPRCRLGNLTQYGWRPKKQKHSQLDSWPALSKTKQKIRFLECKKTLKGKLAHTFQELHQQSPVLSQHKWFIKLSNCLTCRTNTKEDLNNSWPAAMKNTFNDDVVIVQRDFNTRVSCRNKVRESLTRMCHGDVSPGMIYSWPSRKITLAHKTVRG